MQNNMCGKHIHIYTTYYDIKVDSYDVDVFVCC